ncbi:hypothetical protein SAMN05216524_104391 [Mucilaginibacter sp. OK098]|nr:hypothetical protein SAMN05216524_104391 [Mucilaginibacter sp. OK098]
MLHNEQIINNIYIIIKAGITTPAFIIMCKYLKSLNYSFSIAENASNKTFHLWFLPSSQMRT